MDSPFEEFVNKWVRITIIDAGHELSYSGTVTKATADYLFLKDKFDKACVFANTTVKKIQEQERGR